MCYLLADKPLLIAGSSAGAGSGEFHVYRHLRRREYQRQDFMDAMAEKVSRTLYFFLISIWCPLLFFFPYKIMCKQFSSKPLLIKRKQQRNM